MGQGGTVIDFVCEYYNETVKQALQRLENDFLYQSNYSSNNTAYIHQKQKNIPHFNPVSDQQTLLSTTNNEKPQFHIDNVTEITNLALIDYLQERGINLNIATKYLKQVQFHYGTQQWKQLALGFINDTGGNGNKLAVFEGFMDFLSYLTYYNLENFQSSAIILNSVANYQQCQLILADYQFSKVYFFLDNDKAGAETLQKLTEFDSTVSFDWVDMSDRYKNFKDFNEFINHVKNHLHLE